MSTMSALAKLSMATAGAAVIALGVAGTANASPGFSGPYAPSNWTLTNDNADGFVDTADAPSSISITGSDNYSYTSGQTSYTTTAVANSLVSFNWSYSTQDEDGPYYDPFGFLVNGYFTQLTTDDWGDYFHYGSFSTLLNVGDTFGFAVKTFDNLYGSATATVTDFHATVIDFHATVPEPASLIGVLGLGAFGVTSLRKRKQQPSA